MDTPSKLVPAGENSSDDAALVAGGASASASASSSSAVSTREAYYSLNFTPDDASRLRLPGAPRIDWGSKDPEYFDALISARLPPSSSSTPVTRPRSPSGFSEPRHRAILNTGSAPSDRTMPLPRPVLDLDSIQTAHSSAPPRGIPHTGSAPAPFYHTNLRPRVLHSIQAPYFYSSPLFSAPRPGALARPGFTAALNTWDASNDNWGGRTGNEINWYNVHSVPNPRALAPRSTVFGPNSDGAPYIHPARARAIPSTDFGPWRHRPVLNTNVGPYYRAMMLPAPPVAQPPAPAGAYPAHHHLYAQQSAPPGLHLQPYASKSGELKPDMCRYWLRGRCIRGSWCRFAHGPKPLKYKNWPCQYDPHCPYRDDNSCHFLHTSQ